MTPRIFALNHSIHPPYGPSLFNSFLRREPSWEVKSQAQLRGERYPAGKQVLNYNTGLAINLGIRQKKVIDQLWPLLEDYHAHFRSLAYSQELKRRLDNRAITHQLETLAVMEHKDAMEDLVKNVIEESKYQSRGRTAALIENLALKNWQSKNFNLELLRNTIGKRAEEQPIIHKQALDDPFNLEIKRPNDLTYQEKNKFNVDRMVKVELSRSDVSERHGELNLIAKLEDARLLLAAHDFAFRYGMHLSFFNPQSLRMQGIPKLGQTPESVQRVIRILFKQS